jgi:putative Mg2+ transporter-C (MgtC) family protein
MDYLFFDGLINLLAALAVGGLIGLERSYNGRPAGFRTHTLVCMSSSLLMLLTVHQIELLPALPIDAVRIDPTRMAQGIMTGIGFLGAGVIMKEKLTIRGLTTAASIWITASIGILIGIGFYSAAVAATLLTVGVLSTFRWIEAWLPSLHYGHLHVRMPRTRAMSKDQLVEIIRSTSFGFANLSYMLNDKGETIEYQMTVRTRKLENYQRLAEALANENAISEYQLMPVGD